MIPNDWSYDEKTNLPLGWIVGVVNGTSIVQCLCPSCDYGKGYSKPFRITTHIKKALTCSVCKTKFVGSI